MKLLSHYWTAADPIESRREQIIDWIDDLIEFGPPSVADACRDWRREQSRRPAPADIRKLCILAQNRRREDAMRRLPPPAPPPEPPPVTAEERAAVAAQFDWLLRHLKGIPAESQPTGYGVTQRRKAREYNPDELRAGRIALGIEQPQAEAAE